MPGSTPKNCKVYPLTPNKQEQLDAFIQENLGTRWIRPLKSPMASLVLHLLLHIVFYPTFILSFLHLPITSIHPSIHPSIHLNPLVSSQTMSNEGPYPSVPNAQQPVSTSTSIYTCGQVGLHRRCRLVLGLVRVKEDMMRTMNGGLFRCSVSCESRFESCYPWLVLISTTWTEHGRLPAGCLFRFLVSFCLPSHSFWIWPDSTQDEDNKNISQWCQPSIHKSFSRKYEELGYTVGWFGWIAEVDKGSLRKVDTNQILALVLGRLCSTIHGMCTM